MTTTGTRTQLHQLIESLPDRELYTAQRMLEYLLTSDPVRWAIAHAPQGEPLMPE